MRGDVFLIYLEKKRQRGSAKNKKCRGLEPNQFTYQDDQTNENDIGEEIARLGKATRVLLKTAGIGPHWIHVSLAPAPSYQCTESYRNMCQR